jgi:hypothetical protein
MVKLGIVCVCVRERERERERERGHRYYWIDIQVIMDKILHTDFDFSFWGHCSTIFFWLGLNGEINRISGSVLLFNLLAIKAMNF